MHVIKVFPCDYYSTKSRNFFSSFPLPSNNNFIIPFTMLFFLQLRHLLLSLDLNLDILNCPLVQYFFFL